MYYKYNDYLYRNRCIFEIVKTINIIVLKNILLIGTFLLLLFSCNKEQNIVKEDINLNESITSESIINLIDEIKKADRKQDVDLQIDKSIELANIFIQIFEMDQALKYLNAANDLAKNNNKQGRLNSIYYAIGEIYLQSEDYEKAKGYFLKSYQLSILQNEGEQIISDLMKIGFVFHKQNSLDSARYYYKKILKILEANDSKIILPLLYNKLADLYVDEGLFSDAKILYQKGIDSSFFYHNNNYLDLLYLNLGKTYSGLNNFEVAHQLFLKCDSIIDINNNITLKQECNYWLLRNSIIKKSKLELLKYLDANKFLTDSITNYQNKKWKKNADFNYKLGRKESELFLLQEQNYYQKIKFILGFIILLLIAIILIIIVRNKNRKMHQELLLLSKDNELKKLREKQLEEEAKKVKRELEIKNKEILANSLVLLNKNELIENLEAIVKKIQVPDNTENKQAVDEIQSLLRDNTNQENIWNDFKIHFEKVHQDFFDKLTTIHPDLSENDIRLSAYLLIGMQNQEIANISFISTDSVRKRKQRLREKLNLESGKDLVLYLKDLNTAN